ncbi:MAG: S41 family peptidase [Thermoguttaceae bacterium]
MFRRSVAALLSLVICVTLISRAPAAVAEKPAPAQEKEDYYELYKILADTMDQVDRNYVKEVDRRELIEAAIRGIISKLDPYSAYIGPEELGRFRTSVDNEFGGIGIQISTEDGDLRVLSPMYGTPAYRAGIRAGDRIVEIEGKSTDGLSLDDAVARLKGKEGTRVSLTVVHADKPDRVTVAMTRERVRVETVLGDRRNADDSWNYMLDAKQQIGYIRVSAFGRDTANELQKALEQLKSQKVRGLILDLRFNPGGLLGAAIEVSGLFVSEGRIVSVKGRNTPERSWEAHKGGTFEGFPMVVLVNRYSASASEIVSACLQDHQRAVVMGERTWGKGSVQNVIELEDGRSALKLTTAAYCRPSGKNIHRFPNSSDKDPWGVLPDVGFDLRLSESETAALLADRRERDILRTNDRESGKADDPRKADGQRSMPPKLQAGKPGPAAANSEVPAEKSLQASVAKPPAQPASGGKPTAQQAAAAKLVPFVDRQLQMAVKYLSEQLAHAK